MEVLSEHMCEGWLEATSSPAGMAVHLLRGFVHIRRLEFNQHAKAEGHA